MLARSSCNRAADDLLSMEQYGIDVFVAFQSMVFFSLGCECILRMLAIWCNTVPVFDVLRISARLPWLGCWCWRWRWHCLMFWSWCRSCSWNCLWPLFPRHILCLLSDPPIVILVQRLKEEMDERLLASLVSSGFGRSYWCWSNYFLHLHILGLSRGLLFRCLLHLLICVFLDLVSIASWRSFRGFLLVA